MLAEPDHPVYIPRLDCLTCPVDFWTAALGYVRREQDWDPEFMMLIDPARRRLPVSPASEATPDESG